MTRLDGGPPERLARAGVTEREAEVLSAVAQRLHNREIADRLYISVRTVESHISALLRKLGVTDRAALVKVGAEIGRAVQIGTALPVPLTSFVGRDRETDEIAALLQGHRLVTLTGPAGAGKTRLALQVAASGAKRVPDDVRLADLAAIASAELVADTLARALGVSPQPTRPVVDSLRDAARELHGLLLVDNCEHVVAEAAELISVLLAASGQLRVLATSREVLGVPGEVSYQVQPLPVPSPHASSRAATAGGYDAVRLFVDRARDASPGFALTDANAAAVAALCQRLDGLPLAIELAASRVRSFPPAKLVEHLNQRFELLSAGARTVLPRHRTLRATIDWSYDLLGDDERALFDRLGVFPADSTTTRSRRCAPPAAPAAAPWSGCCRRWWTSRWCPPPAATRPDTACWRPSEPTPPNAWPAAAPTPTHGNGTPPTTWRWPSWPPSGYAGRSSGRGWTA
jgi:DNA-binding CsgD family transcriptional regulator